MNPRTEPMSDHTRAVAEAFSGHRFRDVYDHLDPDVLWVNIGGPRLAGKEAVVEACEGTLTGLATTETAFTRFVVVGDDVTSAVDVVAGYTDVDGDTTTVASCDIYEFRDGLVVRVTSYAAEIDPADGGASLNSAPSRAGFRADLARRRCEGGPEARRVADNAARSDAKARAAGASELREVP